MRAEELPTLLVQRLRVSQQWKMKRSERGVLHRGGSPAASTDSAEHYLRSALDGYPRGPESADIRARVARLLDSLAAGLIPPN